MKLVSIKHSGHRKILEYFVKNLLIFTVPVILFFTGVAFYNYEVDPYGVIKGDMDAQITEPNEHYLKMKYILDYPDKYDSFLFGSSRVGKIDVNKISHSDNWYNFAYSEAVPSEIANDLQILLDNNVTIKKVIVGVDELSYLIPEEVHENHSLAKPYMNKLNPFLSYLFLKPSIPLLKQMLSADTSQFYTPGTYNIIYKTGNFSPNKKDEFIEKNPKIHARNPAFESPYWKPYFEEDINGTIKDIEKIKQICLENGIESIFFINPMYKVTYVNAVSYNFFNFLEELSTVTWFYDFSGLNQTTTNEFNFYESSHYRPFIGDKIINSMFLSKNQKRFIVNSDNIDSVIERKKIELKRANIQNRISGM